MYGHDESMWFGGGYMWLFWIILIVRIALVVKLVAGKDSSAPRSSEEESPLSILKKRYARGEIDEEEFERRSRELDR